MLTANFALQLKPVGSSCNINCDYCYVSPFRTGSKMVRMNYQILERAIQECLRSSEYPTISWHGGEPALAGIKFFEEAMRLIDVHKSEGQRVRNQIQTNATLITSNLAKLLKNYDFMVGVSLDGPMYVHSKHRKGKRGESTFERTLRGVDRLKAEGVEPSVIATVTKDNLQYAGEVFDFLVATGFRDIKFSPVFDPGIGTFGITAEEWYRYLSEVFDHWFDIGDENIHVRELEEVIAWIANDTISVCSSNKTCLNWVSVDPSGDLYPCEYFKTEHPYGNIMEMKLAKIVETPQYISFKDVFRKPPEECQLCKFYELCGNGCPATRVRGNLMDPSGVYAFCIERKLLYTKIQAVFASHLQ